MDMQKKTLNQIRYDLKKMSVNEEALAADLCAQDKEGWAQDDGIAYCHAGYMPAGRKLAYAAQSGEKTFSVVEKESGKAVFTGEVRNVETENGVYAEMDFSGLTAEGEYRLVLGDVQTHGFVISDFPWDSAVWKELRYFMEKRCGYDVPGVHRSCHGDCFSVHPDGRRAFVMGGWHDRGDFSHDLCSTAEAARALMAMAVRVRNTDERLSDRLLEEARVGLEWMQATRFGDGYRCVEIAIPGMTNGCIDDDDDVKQPAHNDPYSNYCAAAVSAAAAAVFDKEDHIFAQYCLRCAKEDFRFAYEHMNVRESRSYEIRRLGGRIMLFGIHDYWPECQMNGQAAAAAAALYEATGDKWYLEHAARFAKLIMACQQKTALPGALPVGGFFCEDRSFAQPVFDDTDAAAVEGLAQLVKLAPEHPDADKWREALAAYGAYLKALAGMTKPYHVLSVKPEKAEDGSVSVRKFPGKGVNEALLVKAEKAAAIADALGDDCLKQLAADQVEWVLGCNPFAVSMIYGEGYGFRPVSDISAKEAVGAVPAGFGAAACGNAPSAGVDAESNLSGLKTAARLVRLLAKL